jgi:quercetin dioxygenase-like cupin family protein
MQLRDIPFETADWNSIEAIPHAGEVGTAFWRMRQCGDVRVRMVEYTPGYVADHWCEKGHILLCLDGELRTELKDGRVITLKAGMSYHVSDGAEPHRSTTATGALLFIVD